MQAQTHTQAHLERMALSSMLVWEQQVFPGDLIKGCLAICLFLAGSTRIGSARPSPDRSGPALPGPLRLGLARPDRVGKEEKTFVAAPERK